jgi:hypothetical protein
VVRVSIRSRETAGMRRVEKRRGSRIECSVCRGLHGPPHPGGDGTLEMQQPVRLAHG